MSGYFRNFPIISYNNTAVVDITRRDMITQRARKTRFAFHDYQIRESQRADFVAEKYYDDPLSVWLVWFSGNIIDPYYGWYLSTEQFNDFIVDKYTTIANAQSTIAYWQLAWDSLVDDITSLSDYAALPDPLRKYYNAKFDTNGNIISYKINRQDWRMATNMTVTWLITQPTANGANSSFVKGEKVILYHSNTNVGNSVVKFANSSFLVTQHVFGNTSPAGNSSNNRLTGQTSNVTANLISVDNVVLNMPINELVYFSPVTYFEDETMKNEDRKFVRLLDSKYALQAQNELEKTLAE